jgi:molybdopterin-guanine dinucleotide biosynthesis protein A
VIEAGLVTLGILAGGQARRLGGIDKALAQYRGATLAQRTLDAIGSGFAQQLASYNGLGEAALPAGLSVVRDRRPGFLGPLAGIESLLAASASPWLLTVPVDLGEIPADLVERLLSCLEGGDGVAVLDGDGAQPLVALWPVDSSRAAVGAALDAGERAVHRVQQILGFGECPIAPTLLGNLNSPDDFGSAH